MEPMLVVANANAGTSDRAAIEAAVDVLARERSVEVARTADQGELDSVLHRAGSRTIVVAGGDGSLHAVVSALHRRHELQGRTLGLVPLGTGNDFARAVGIPLDAVDAAHALLAGRPTPTDMLVDECGRVTVNAVHVGAGAEAARSGAAWKQVLGRVGYPLGAVRHVVAPRSYRLRVEVDGTVVNDLDRPVLQVAAAIGRSVGGGAVLAPDAEVDDGKVDIVISRATGPIRSIGYAAAVLAQRHPDRPDVEVLHGRTVKVSGEGFWHSSDGELAGPDRSVAWRIEPAAYQLVRVLQDEESGKNQHLTAQ